MLVASRNLTFDASWDTVVRLDETADGAGADLDAVGDLFEGLLSTADGAISSDHEDRVASLSAALRAAIFALPQVWMASRPHPRPRAHRLAPADRRPTGRLIISPFVSDDFFTSVRPAPVDELVSRPESLDLLAREHARAE